MNMINKLLIITLLFFSSCSIKDNLGQELNKNDSDLIKKMNEKYSNKIKFSINDNHVSCLNLIKIDDLESLPEEINLLTKLDSIIIYKTNINDKKIDLKNIKGLKYIKVGYLNLSEYQLLFNESIDDITIYFCNFNKFPESIKNADLKKISFYRLGKEYENIIPKKLIYPNLEEIKFSSVNFDTYPEIISNKLRKIEVYNQETLQNLPKSYSKNRYETIKLMNCENLKTLDGILNNSQESLKEFELSDMNKEFKIPFDDLSKCKNLEILDLSGRYYSHIKELEKYDFYINFKKLKVLVYTGIPIDHVVPQIKELKELEYLGLNKNRITTLPIEIRELPNLKRIYISENPFEILPAEMFDVDRQVKTEIYSSYGWDIVPEFLRKEDVERGYSIHKVN
ncbi:hypothetical protein MY04_4921 [Flammeovirga sp. MY04]|uniref:hypothetical protein n=1 Tax=Flammeovirga sp. MY04 TaxID=1191459 RepID=UPI00080622A4|nr:hypothetical protein [Flammeovirga sp. MY04]ANQ52256.1 hypothetical protein MY04_4921 [Flammeovirga sp. MY04]